MQNIVVGTAGHIDHGKTALVRALTGIDTDRLQEEKRRGISIDLGFAFFSLNENMRVALVDVPGHERFIKNMLAGIGGIDMVLLVIAADESIKPQTREHFDICRLLRIPRGVVALTKADLADPEWLDLVQLEVREFLAGSFLEKAPIVPVSSVSGQGLAELRTAMAQVATGVSVREAGAPFRMPIDRSFALSGFGTVVTGTALAGTVAVENEVDLWPAGRRLRVRSVQVHGKPSQRASAGQRIALNLPGATVEAASRGAVVGAINAFQPSRTVDCLFTLLSSARPLKSRAPIHLHAGTAEVLAHIRILDGSAAIEPGEDVPVRLILRKPLVLVPGDRFVVRLFSPVVTIGGGEIVDPFPPGRARGSDLAQRTRTMARASTAERIGTLVAESRFGLAAPAVAKHLGITISIIMTNLPKSVEKVPDGVDWLLDRGWMQRTAERWRKMLAEYHRANPLSPGLRREELRTRELPEALPAVFEAVLRAERTIVSSGEVVHLASHTLALKADEEHALAAIEGAFQTAGLSVPGVDDVLASSGVDAVRARSLLSILLRQKRLVRVTSDLVFHPGALQTLRTTLSIHRGKRFTVSEFKEWTGISRKYAIPLLEYLDRERVTRRDGNERLVLT